VEDQKPSTRGTRGNVPISFSGEEEPPYRSGAEVSKGKKKPPSGQGEGKKGGLDNHREEGKIRTQKCLGMPQMKRPQPPPERRVISAGWVWPVLRGRGRHQRPGLMTTRGRLAERPEEGGKDRRKLATGGGGIRSLKMTRRLGVLARARFLLLKGAIQPRVLEKESIGKRKDCQAKRRRDV